MIISVFIFSIFITFIKSETEDDDFSEFTKEGIHILNHLNFKKFTTMHKFAVNAFIQPTCKESNTLLFEYSRVVADLKLADIPDMEFGILGCKEAEDICFLENAVVDPHIYCYVGDRHYEFKNKLSYNNLKTWLQGFIYHDPILIKNEHHAQDLFNKSNVAVLIFNSTLEQDTIDQQLSIFNQAGQNHFELKLAYYYSDKIYSFSDSIDQTAFYNIVVKSDFKDSTEIHSSNEIITYEKMNEFMNESKIQEYSEWDYSVMRNIVKWKKNGIVLFTEHFNTLKSLYFTEVSKMFKTNLIFTYVLRNSTVHKSLKSFFGARKTKKEFIRLISYEQDEIKKYKLDNWNKEGLVQFVQNYLDGKLVPYFMSAPPAENQTAALIKTVVGSNFEEMVLKNDQNVLMIAYLNVSDESQTYLNYFTEYMNVLQHAIGDSFIAVKFEVGENEHPLFKFRTFPSIVLYKKNHKNKPILFTSSFHYRYFVRFLEKQLGKLRYPGDEKIVPVDGSL